MKVERSEDADDDLTDIYLYGLLTFGAASADTYFDGLQHCFSLLREHPELGRARPEIRPGIHVLVHRAHIILYDIEAERVMIQRVLHHSMDVERHSVPRE